MARLLPTRSKRAAGQSPLISSLAGYKAMLDCLEAKVFVCDCDMVLVYANKAAVREASRFADQFQRFFGVGLDELIGGSIHRFHADPQGIERILRNPGNLPYRSTHRFENVVLHGQISVVTDDAGTILGYCLAWENVSEQEGIEKTARRVAEQLAAASAELSTLGATLDRAAGATAEKAGVAAAATETAELALAEISRIDVLICSVAVAATPAFCAVAVAASSSVAPSVESSPLAAASCSATCRAVSSMPSCSLTFSQARQ